MQASASDSEAASARQREKDDAHGVLDARQRPLASGVLAVLNPLSPVEQMEVVLERLGKTKTNAEFLASMQT